MFYIPKIDWQRREGFYCIPLNFTEYHQSISEEQNLRKVAGSFYIFLTTSGEVEKYVRSNSSDDYIHQYNDSNKIRTNNHLVFFLLRFSPCKVEQPLQGMEL